MRNLYFPRHRPFLIIKLHQEQRLPAHPPLPRIRLLPLFHIEIGLKASERAHELSSSLNFLADVLDQHIFDPGSAPLVCPPPMCNGIGVDAESAWMGSLRAYRTCGEEEQMHMKNPSYYLR